MYRKSKELFGKNYLWVSIDGTDAVGKTTLIKKLKKLLNKEIKNTNLDIEIVATKEFSDSETGLFIEDLIKKRRFFSLSKSKKGHLPISETMLLASDFIYQIEKLLADKNRLHKKLLIISDRGPQSFTAYQLTRIKNSHKNVELAGARRWIINLFRFIGEPNLNILLISPIAEIRKRIVKREKSISPSELKFIKDVQDEFVKIFKQKNYFIIENKDKGINVAVGKVLNRAKKVLKI